MIGKNKRKKELRKFMKYINDYQLNSPISLCDDDCEICYPSTSTVKVKAKPMPITISSNYRSFQDQIMALGWTAQIKSNGETSMNTRDPEIDKRKYLNDRTWSIFSKKETNLMREFGLTDDEYPKNAKDLIQRIKDGRYVLPTDADDYEYSIDSIRFRDPKKEKDFDGYTKARGLLTEEYTKVKDAVAILPVEDALKSVQEFDNYPN